TEAPAEPSAASAPQAAPSGDLAAAAVKVWASEVMPAMKSLPRAIYAATKLVGARDGAVVIAAPNDAHRAKCLQHQKDIEAAVAKAVGGAVPVTVVVDGAAAHDDDTAELGGPGASGNVVQLPAAAVVEDDDEIDLDDLVDAPAEAVVSPVDRLTSAFPGAQLVDE
ncbi:MAG TPA: hypothetical protein PLV13_00240, partial [Ilumatobacteraceae bacterium]|nr:hypothetical protein [Ilumatobacteraceae bacterium]